MAEPAVTEALARRLAQLRDAGRLPPAPAARAEYAQCAVLSVERRHTHGLGPFVRAQHDTRVWTSTAVARAHVPKEACDAAYLAQLAAAYGAADVRVDSVAVELHHINVALKHEVVPQRGAASGCLTAAWPGGELVVAFTAPPLPAAV